MPCSVAALVLAAGSSRRFGADKRMAPLADGRTLLASALALPCALLAETWVVVRPDDDVQVFGLLAPVNWVRSHAHASGMGHSLASGVQALLEESQAQAVAIFLGDMPWLRAESVRTLMCQADPARIVVPCVVGQRGHPVIIGRDFWPELADLTGDQGAREVLRAHSDAVHEIALDDPGLLRDVDTPAMLE